MSPAFGWILAVSALLKVALAVAFTGIEPHYDEMGYLALGSAMAQGLGPPLPWRAPGYPVFVAAGLLAGGGHVLGVRLLQVALSVLASLLVYRIGRAQWGERAGLTAGAFVAFYPSQVAFSHLLWSETLFGCLVLLALERLLAADARRSARTALAAGLLLGLASLTRSSAVRSAPVRAAARLARRDSRSRAGRPRAALRRGRGPRRTPAW